MDAKMRGYKGGFICYNTRYRVALWGDWADDGEFVCSWQFVLSTALDLYCENLGWQRREICQCLSKATFDIGAETFIIWMEKL